MEDKHQEEHAIFDVCTPLKECEGITPSTRSNTNEQNKMISTNEPIEMMLQNDLINSTEKEIVIVEKGTDEDQSALNLVPGQKPNPSSAAASTKNKAGPDQIGDAPPPPPPAPATVPAPAEPNRPPKHKCGRRGRPRSTRTIVIDPSPEPGTQDSWKQRRGRPTITDDDDCLPPGWELRIETRQNGATAGLKDKYYQSPEGRRFRSRIAVESYLRAKKIAG